MSNTEKMFLPQARENFLHRSTNTLLQQFQVQVTLIDIILMFLSRQSLIKRLVFFLIEKHKFPTWCFGNELFHSLCRDR